MHANFFLHFLPTTPFTCVWRGVEKKSLIFFSPFYNENLNLFRNPLTDFFCRKWTHYNSVFYTYIAFVIDASLMLFSLHFTPKLKSFLYNGRLRSTNKLPNIQQRKISPLCRANNICIFVKRKKIYWKGCRCLSLKRLHEYGRIFVKKIEKKPDWLKLRIAFSKNEKKLH